MPIAFSQGEFTNPEAVTIRGYDGTAEDPYITSDEKYLLFDNHADATSGATPGKSTLFYAKERDYKTFDFIGRVRGIEEEGPGGQAAPAIDSAGILYFLTGRSHAENYISIWHGAFADGTVTKLAPVVGISRGEPGWFNMGASPTRDGRYLFFTDNGATTSTIVVAAKNPDGTFTRLPDSAALLKNVNDGNLSPFHIVYGPRTSRHGLELVFAAPPRIFIASRNSAAEAFGIPQVVDAGNMVPEPHLAEGPSLSADGKHLYYHILERPGHSQIYVLSRQ